MGKEKDTKINHTVYNIEDVGQVQIADEVVAVIAGLAATEVEGVAKMSGNITNEIVSKLGMKKLSKGVKVTITGTQVDVTLNLVLSYGVSIPKTSQEVQDKVKSAIETMTGLTVSEVNIRIAGIQMDYEQTDYKEYTEDNGGLTYEDVQKKSKRDYFSFTVSRRKDQIYIETKIGSILKRLPEIDEQIHSICEGWRLERLGKPELAILRLAVYEITNDANIPTGVAINEAVELAKIYCSEEAPRFVNGVLAKLAQRIIRDLYLDN